MEPTAIRSVRVLREVTLDDQPEAAGRPPTHGILNGTHMVEYLRDAVRGALGMVLLAATGVQIPVRLGAAVSEPHRGFSGALAILVTAQAPEGFVQAPWKPGMAVSVWFSHPRGVHGFQSRIVTGTKDQLRLDLPQRLIRFARRAVERCVIPPCAAITVDLPLVDGNPLEGVPVLDLSPAGVGLELPPDVAFPVGSVTRLRLSAPGRPALEVAGAVRHIGPDLPEGGVRYGLQFVGLTHVETAALSRILERFQKSACGAVANARQGAAGG